MYSIYFNNNLVYASGDYDYVVEEPILTLQANKAGSLKFTLPKNNPVQLTKLKNVLEVYDDNVLIWKGRVLSSELNFYNDQEIIAEGKLASLNDSLYRATSFTGSVEELFTAILTNHNSQVTSDQQLLVGNVTVEDPNDYIVREWSEATSSWDLIQKKLVDMLGGYLVIRYESNGDYLDYIAEEDFMAASSQYIEFGKNLLDLTQFVDGSEIYTACIPLGAEIVNKTYSLIEYTVEDPPTWEFYKYYELVGQDYVLIETELEFNAIVSVGGDLYTVTAEEKTGVRVDIKSVNQGKDYIINSNAQALYGTIYAPQSVTIWDDVTVPSNLLAKATAWLNNQGVMLVNEIKVNFCDLSKLGVVVDGISLYDLVVVNSRYHDIAYAQYLVKELKLNLDAPESSSLSVGATSLSLTDKTIAGGSTSSGGGEAGPQGPPGEDGKSAYEAAVEGGYTDPESTFNTDLADIGNKTTYDYVTQKISESATSVIDTAEEYTRTLINTCTSSTEFATYQQTIQNQFSQTIDGFNFNFNTLSQQLTAVGNKVTTQESYIRLENGVIIIGKADSPVTARFTNSALEFLYNGTKVAEFTNEKLWVKNIQTDNQVAFGAQWAIRPGNYISNIGNNLNIMWIGGNS